MKNKVSFLLIFLFAFMALSGCKHQPDTTRQNNIAYKAKNKSEKDASQSKVKQSNQQSSSSVNNKAETQITNSEWVLMGYMSYARNNYEQSENVQNTREMVEAVENDVNNNDLVITKSSDNKYVFSNKYGSVNGTVTENNVEITGDGTTDIDKTKLKSQYLNWIDQIQILAKKITTNSNNTKNPKLNNAFSLKDYIVAGYIESMRHGATPKEKITYVENLLARGIDVANDEYFSGLYKNNGKYSVAYSSSTSQYIEFTLKGNNIVGTIHLGDVVSGHLKTTKEELQKKYSPHKSDLIKILQGLEYNKAHVRDYYRR